MAPDLVALPIERIVHETMSQRVYGDLRELIMSGRVQPGQRLTLKNLSEAVGTSQMPVREALRQLAAEGALEFLPNKSVRVPVMTKEKFLELLAIRLQVEGLALEQATQRITKPPRELVKAVAGKNFVELPEADVCCGSAGTYNLTEPEMAVRLQRRKTENILRTNADGSTVRLGEVARCEVGTEKYRRGIRSADRRRIRPLSGRRTGFTGRVPEPSARRPRLRLHHRARI